MYDFGEELILANSLEKYIESDIKVENSNDEKHSLPTELNNKEGISIPQQLPQNNNEILLNNGAENVCSISQNNNRKIKTLTQILQNPLKEEEKEKANSQMERKEKGSTLTSGSTGNFQGKILGKSTTVLMGSMHTCSNYRYKFNKVKKLERINYKNQFKHNEDNKRLIKLQLHKIFERIFRGCQAS